MLGKSFLKKSLCCKIDVKASGLWVCGLLSVVNECLLQLRSRLLSLDSCSRPILTQMRPIYAMYSTLPLRTFFF